MIYTPMWNRVRRILVALAAAVLLAGAASYLTQGGFAWAFGNPKPPKGPPAGRSLGDLFFGKNMARAEVILVLQGVVHDFRIDRGRVQGVVAGQLVLRELDGTVQQVPVAPDARVDIDGQPAPLTALARGLYATAIRDGNAPASIVQASFRRG